MLNAIIQVQIIPWIILSDAKPLPAKCIDEHIRQLTAIVIDINDALRAFRPEREGVYDAPLTPEKALMFLHEGR